MNSHSSLPVSMRGAARPCEAGRGARPSSCSDRNSWRIARLSKRSILRLLRGLRTRTQNVPPRKRAPAYLQEGFTLLEMIIVISILVLLTGLIANIQSSIFKRREDIAQEGAFYNAIRFSMNVLQRDMLHLYSPTAMSPKTPTQPGTLPGSQPAQNVTTLDPSDSSARTTAYWGAATDAMGIRPSRFVGTETALSFVSSSHIRIYKNAKESEFAKISYELKSDTQTLSDGSTGGGQALFRTENPNVFDDEERRSLGNGVGKYILLHGIKALKFRYYNVAQTRWESRWDSESEEFKNKYPEMIEVQLAVLGPVRLSYDGTFLYRPEMPLNGLPITY